MSWAEWMRRPLRTVETRLARLPDAWPVGKFDLIVLSELGYFMSRDDWTRTVEQASASLTANGTIVGCHWLRPFAARTMSSRHLHAIIARQDGLHRHVRHVEPDFLLDVWSRNPQSLRSREALQ